MAYSDLLQQKTSASSYQPNLIYLLSAHKLLLMESEKQSFLLNKKKGKI